MLETTNDEKLKDPPPDAFVKVALGVMVKFVAPEHAAVAVVPCPNSIGIPVLSEIFAASVVCTKNVPPTNRSRSTRMDENFRFTWPEESSTGSSL